MPPVPEMTTSDDIVGSNQEPQQPDDDGVKLDTVDLEKGIGGTQHPPTLLLGMANICDGHVLQKRWRLRRAIGKYIILCLQ